MGIELLGPRKQLLIMGVQTEREREVGRGGSIVAGTHKFRPELHSPPWTPFTFFGSEECREEEEEKLLVKATGAEELKQERQIWRKR